MTAVVIVFYFNVALGRVGRRTCTGEYESSGAVRSDEVDVVFLQDFSCTLGKGEKKRPRPIDILMSLSNEVQAFC